ncbi:MAG: metallophosphoesterase [Verrucomicrobiia bacterium]
MNTKMHIAVVSDIHYSCHAERARHDFEEQGVPNPFLRQIAKLYRRFVWLKDPLNHYHRLDLFIEKSGNPDFCFALGDYTCDTAFIGVADDLSFQSANECLNKLQNKFGDNFKALIGDHELGKLSLFGGVGGLRLASYQRAINRLNLEPYWKLEFGKYAFIGITSTVIAMPIFQSETLVDEKPLWLDLYKNHLKAVSEIFNQIRNEKRIILLCHDPSALCYLAEEPAVKSKLNQIELTLIGHLHSNAVFKASQYLSGIPQINFLGHTPKRLTHALRKSKVWKSFNIKLCPSLSGIQLLKDGGFCTLSIDLNGNEEAQFTFHHLKW